MLAEPPAFWMSQSRLYFSHCCLRAVGSAVIQRGEDVVSGRMMPTLAPLPSTAPESAELDGSDAELELLLELLSSLEPPQPASAIARPSPMTAIDTLVLRMR